MNRDEVNYAYDARFCSAGCTSACDRSAYCGPTIEKRPQELRVQIQWTPDGACDMLSRGAQMFLGCKMHQSAIFVLASTYRIKCSTHRRDGTSCSAFNFVPRRDRRRNFSIEFSEIIIARGNTDFDKYTVTATVAAATGFQSFDVVDHFGWR